MSERAWDIYERLGQAIGDHLERLAIAIAMAFIAMFSLGVAA